MSHFQGGNDYLKEETHGDPPFLSELKLGKDDEWVYRCDKGNPRSWGLSSVKVTCNNRTFNDLTPWMRCYSITGFLLAFLLVLRNSFAAPNGYGGRERNFVSYLGRR